MEKIEDLFNIPPESWLLTLPTYQQRTIRKLYEETGDYEDVAKAWLFSKMSTTAPFGTEKEKSIFYEKILDEIESFLVGNEKYKGNRLEILKETGAVQNYAVGVISAALSPYLDAAAVFLAPVIVITLFTVTKIGIHAWLSAREEKRNTNVNT